MLITAHSDEQAVAKAQALKAAVYEFVNVDGYRMQNVVTDIVDVAPLVQADFADGAELYSRYFPAERLRQYRAFEPHLHPV